MTIKIHLTNSIYKRLSELAYVRHQTASELASYYLGLIVPIVDKLNLIETFSKESANKVINKKIKKRKRKIGHKKHR
jgi:hypothetical protein